MKKIVLDAYCKMPKSFIDANNVALIDIPYFINDKVYHFSDYTKNDYLDINESFFVIEEAYIDSNIVENMLQEILYNDNDEILYLCTIDNKSINFGKIKEIISLFKDKYNQKFEVVYLPSNNIATRFLIEKASELICTKDRLIDVRKDVEKLINSYSSFVLLEDKNIITKHLARPSMALVYGAKPIYNIKLDNSFEQIARVEGLTNGINRLFNTIEEFNKGNTIVLSYAKSAKHAELLEHLLNKKYGEKVRIEKRFLEPMLISQFGLGAIVISFIDSLNDEKSKTVYKQIKN